MKRLLLLIISTAVICSACVGIGGNSEPESSAVESPATEENASSQAETEYSKEESSAFETESSISEESSESAESSEVEESVEAEESSEQEESFELEESSAPEESSKPEPETALMTDSGHTVELLGNPYSKNYSKFKKSLAHIPWDIALFDNKLFVGSGDYDVNSGPVPMKHYDLLQNVWVSNGTLRDEAVMRFVEINGELVATGTDPKDSWKFGNYYVWRNGKWVTKRVLPDSIHNFDIIEFNGCVFAAGGALDVNNMITVSRDGGETFEPVPFNCETVITEDAQKRVYNLFVLENELYAVFSDCSVYRYTDSGFIYTTHWNGNADFLSKVMLNGTLYFTSGHLFRVDNVYKGEVIELSDSGTVEDVCVYNGSVYAVVSEENENASCTVSVWKGTGNDFSKLFEFEYPIEAFSIAVGEKGVFLGMGKNTESKRNHENCGDILKIGYPID